MLCNTFIQAWGVEQFTLSASKEGQMFTSIVYATLRFGIHTKIKLILP